MSVHAGRRAFGGKIIVLPKQIRAQQGFFVDFCCSIVAKNIPSPAWCIAIS
jgi:hypothetical protein